MSKSLGNLVSPDQLIGTLGKAESSKKTPSSLLDKKWAVDVLRLWVAASDYTYDVSLGLQQLLKVGPIFGMNRIGSRIVSEVTKYESVLAVKSL